MCDLCEKIDFDALEAYRRELEDYEAAEDLAELMAQSETEGEQS